MHDDARRIRLALYTIALLLALNGMSAMYALGWRAIACNVGVVLVLDCIYIIRYRDAQVGRWLLLGLAAGSVELLTDRWLVGTHTLVYPSDEPMIWASPAYMPLAWAVVLVQMGLIGDWLRPRQGWLPATLLTALLAGINLPMYEHLAKDANYWFYQFTPMFLNTPYYIICAEFLLALPLVGLGAMAARMRLRWSLSLGVVEGLWMFPIALLAFWLLGPCTGAVIQWPCR